MYVTILGTTGEPRNLWTSYRGMDLGVKTLNDPNRSEVEELFKVAEKASSGHSPTWRLEVTADALGRLQEVFGDLPTGPWSRSSIREQAIAGWRRKAEELETGPVRQYWNVREALLINANPLQAWVRLLKPEEVNEERWKTAQSLADELGLGAIFGKVTEAYRR